VHKAVATVSFIFCSEGAGFSGESYDRNVFEASLSTVNKLQRDYWTAKQVIRKKLGKADDQCIISSDSELDAKLDVRFLAWASYDEVWFACLRACPKTHSYQIFWCLTASWAYYLKPHPLFTQWALHVYAGQLSGIQRIRFTSVYN